MATAAALFLFSEGTGTSIGDTAAGTPVNLTATLGTGGSWAASNGNGIAFGTGAAGAVSGALNGTKIATAFSGLKTAALEVRCNMTRSGATETLIYFGDTGTAAGLMLQNDFGVITVYVCGAYVGSFDVGTGLHTYHLAVDTTQATAANRVILYKDAVAATMSGASYPAQNTAIDVGITSYASNRLCVGCEGTTSGTQVQSGTIYEACFYSTTISSVEASANHTALAANNDADPNGPAPPAITAQPTTQYVAVGGTPTFTLTVTNTGTGLTYQWKDRSASNVGTNSNSYSPGAVTLADSGKSFYCEVTDSNGTTTSNTVYLIVTIDAMPFLFENKTITGTSFADTGLSFPVAANTDYVFRFALRVWCDATTTGARFQLTGPASPTAVAAGAFIPSGTGAANAGVVTALSTSFFATTAGTVSTTPVLVIIEGIFRNGANAGTLSLQAAAEVVSPGAVTVAAGSVGTIAVASGSTFCRVTATRTTTGTVFADVTDASFSVAASTKYRFRFIVFFTGNATTTGARFGVTAPASPTSVRLGSQQNSGTAAQDSGSVAATATIIVAATSGPGATSNWALIEGVLQNGANAGTLQLQSAAEVVSPGTVIVATNSYGTLEVVT